MQLLSMALVVADIVCTLVFAYSVYLVLRLALPRVSEWRVSAGRRAISPRAAVVLAALSALSALSLIL